MYNEYMELHILILVIFMRIRLLKRNEIGVVAKLFVDSYKKDEKNRRWNEQCAERYILNLHRMCKDLCFVAIDNEKIVGAALCVIVPEFNKDIVESKVLLVHPDYRRKKIGSKLMRKICIKAENKYGIKEIESSIYTLTNFPITWYESIGFRTRKYYEVTRASIKNVLRVI